MGYAGGTKENPTYYNLGDHSETVRIEYDPDQISYEELLGVFWDSHSPLYPTMSRQYMSAIFYHSEAQRELALKSKQQQESIHGSEIFTQVVAAAEFYTAEDYHQKYYLRQIPGLLAELTAIYPDTEDFLNSTAVTRINGYLGGYVALETVQAKVDDFGLSAEGKQQLLDAVSRRLGSVICSLG